MLPHPLGLESKGNPLNPEKRDVQQFEKDKYVKFQRNPKNLKRIPKNLIFNASSINPYLI